MRRRLSLFALLAIVVFSTACVRARPYTSPAGAPDPACASACQQLKTDCQAAETVSTLFLIPAYIVLMIGVLFAGGGNCGGFNSEHSCRGAYQQCISGCPWQRTGR